MMMGGGIAIALIVLVLFLLLIGGGIAVVIWLVNQGARGGSRHPEHEGAAKDEALDTLRRRYAAGEIDREEFERMREELRS